MADDPGVFSIRSILSNADYVSNWITTVAVAGGFSALIGFKDKLTGAALMVSFSTSALFAIAGWPILLQFGYGGVGFGIGYGVLCGVGGMFMLLTLISIIRRIYQKRDDIADTILHRAGIETPTANSKQGAAE